MKRKLFLRACIIIGCSAVVAIVVMAVGNIVSQYPLLWSSIICIACDAFVLSCLLMLSIDNREGDKDTQDRDPVFSLIAWIFVCLLLLACDIVFIGVKVGPA